MGERLPGRVAFISGIARGQGRAHAVRLAKEGADIIGVDAAGPVPSQGVPSATPEDLAETVRLVEASGRRMIARQASVADLSAVTAVVDEGVAELGRLDIVVANAGVGETPLRSWRLRQRIGRTYSPRTSPVPSTPSKRLCRT